MCIPWHIKEVPGKKTSSKIFFLNFYALQLYGSVEIGDDFTHIKKLSGTALKYHYIAHIFHQISSFSTFSS